MQAMDGVVRPAGVALNAGQQRRRQASPRGSGAAGEAERRGVVVFVSGAACDGSTLTAEEVKVKHSLGGLGLVVEEDALRRLGEQVSICCRHGALLEVPDLSCCYLSSDRV